MIGPGMDLRRIRALATKETLQILRDPSVFLIAFVLPIVMLFLFAYAVSLDIKRIPIAVVLESDSGDASSLAAAFSGSRYFQVTPARHRDEVADRVAGGDLRGMVVIPGDFAADERHFRVQVLTDGTQPNTANFVAAYAEGVVRQRQAGLGLSPASAASIVPRFWFNQEIESRRFLVPGAIAVVMTIIGTLLTALVVAREWERGTMEALLSTPARIAEILLGKLIPYFLLGLGATLCATLLAVTLFEVPLRGSWGTLLLLSACFLLPALGQGLLISTIARNQFIAGQAALLSGFLPAFLLSGFLYDIDAMPLPLRLLTRLVPARYYVSSLQTLFLAGDVWAVLLPNMLTLLGLGAVLMLLIRRISHRTLDH